MFCITDCTHGYSQATPCCVGCKRLGYTECWTSLRGSITTVMLSVQSAFKIHPLIPQEMPYIFVSAGEEWLAGNEKRFLYEVKGQKWLDPNRTPSPLGPLNIESEALKNWHACMLAAFIWSHKSLIKNFKESIFSFLPWKEANMPMEIHPLGMMSFVKLVMLKYEDVGLLQGAFHVLHYTCQENSRQCQNLPPEAREFFLSEGAKLRHLETNR